MSPIRSTWLVLALAACAADPSAPDPSAGSLFVAASSEQGVRIENHDAVARYHIVVERETAALVDLSFDPAGEASWFRIPGGGSVVVPWEAVLGHHPGARAVVVHSWIRSVPIEVPGGIQWGTEGHTWREVPL